MLVQRLSLPAVSRLAQEQQRELQGTAVLCRRMLCSQASPLRLHSGTEPSGWVPKMWSHPQLEPTAG